MKFEMEMPLDSVVNCPQLWKIRQLARHPGKGAPGEPHSLWPSRGLELSPIALDGGRLSPDKLWWKVWCLNTAPYCDLSQLS